MHGHRLQGRRHVSANLVARFGFGVVVWVRSVRYPRLLFARQAQVRAFVVPEINYGQLVLEVERCAAGKCDVWPVPHGGGGVHNPADIAEIIAKAAP